MNRRAGGVRRRPRLLSDLRRIVGSRGEVVPTFGPHELHVALRHARAAGVDTIGVCGGDGTNLATLTAVARAWRDAPWPRIALLAGGTVNTATTGLGFGGPVTDNLAALLEADEPRVVRHPLLQVNDKVGLIMGSSMICRVLDEYYEGTTGPLGCAVLAARIVGSAVAGGPLTRRLFAPEQVELEIDGHPVPIRTVHALVASVAPVVAVGMRLTCRAGEDGGFHIVAIDRPAASYAPDVARLWLGLGVPGAAVDTVAHRARIRLPPDGRYTLDGDIFEGTDLRLEATPPVELVGPPLR